MTETDAPSFGAGSTALEVIEGVDLSGKTALVTGASSGIGVETARALMAAGAHVTLAVRDTKAGERTAAELQASTGNGNVRVVHLDLADLATVRALASAWSGPLHLLINNAGIMHTPELRTADGWEPRTCCSRSRRQAAGQSVASRRRRSCRVASGRICSGTGILKCSPT